METKDIIPTEQVIEEIKEVIPTGTNRLKTAAKVGVIGAASIAAWEFAVKPVCRKVKTAIVKRKATRKARKTKAEDEDVESMELDDIPEIDD